MCVCVCVCVVSQWLHIRTLWRQPCVAISRIPPPPEYANVPMPGKMQSSTVVAQLLGLFLFNSVPLRTRMCLCVKAVPVWQATCG